MKFPLLLSNSQVAMKLGITRQNMPHQRKTKGFPEPVIIVDKFPMWLESDITTWIELKTVSK
jgi:predicted DNA-binding transcriptional regulator AlpA